MDELCKLGDDHPDPGEAQGLGDGQLSQAKEEVPALSSSSVLCTGPQGEGAAGSPSPPQSPPGPSPSPSESAAPPLSSSEKGSPFQEGIPLQGGCPLQEVTPLQEGTPLQEASTLQEGIPLQEGSNPSQGEEPHTWQESPLQGVLREKVVDLMWFLIHKYQTKESTTLQEMLNTVTSSQRVLFPVIFSLARECIQMLFGIDIEDADLSGHSYVLVPTLGLTYRGVQDGEPSLPKTGLLAMVLGVIFLRGHRVSEEELWESLRAIGVCPGAEHPIFGEPRELLTHVWVQEQYLQYRQVPLSCPARYEFLWGPRAHAETSGSKVVMRLLAGINSEQFLPCASRRCK